MLNIFYRTTIKPCLPIHVLIINGQWIAGNLECLELFKANVSECLKVFGAVLSAYVLGVAVL